MRNYIRSIRALCGDYKFVSGFIFIIAILYYISYSLQRCVFMPTRHLNSSRPIPSELSIAYRLVHESIARSVHLKCFHTFCLSMVFFSLLVIEAFAMAVNIIVNIMSLPTAKWLSAYVYC
jgi:hypothetical protein